MASGLARLQDAPPSCIYLSLLRYVLLVILHPYRLALGRPLTVAAVTTAVNAAISSAAVASLGAPGVNLAVAPGVAPGVSPAAAQAAGIASGTATSVAESEVQVLCYPPVQGPSL